MVREMGSLNPSYRLIIQKLITMENLKHRYILHLIEKFSLCGFLKIAVVDSPFTKNRKIMKDPIGSVFTFVLLSCYYKILTSGVRFSSLL